VGYLICYQNYLLFGKSAVGLLFIPSLARRSGMDYICVTTNPSSSQVTMAKQDTTVSVSWKAIPSVASYKVQFYSSSTTAAANGTAFGAPVVVSSSTLTATSGTVTAGTFYYATVTGVGADGSQLAPVPSSGAIQV